MAVEIGTATDPDDLYTKLVSFLTTNADLVAAGQEWSVVWSSPTTPASEKVVKGPGLSGQDQVYVGLSLFKDVAGDSYGITCRGMTGVLPNSTQYNDHVNVSPSWVTIFLDKGTMSYWFVANGRRFMVVVKISTVFETLYAGLFLPYATPLSYPYPLFIGGSTGENGDGTYQTSSWRSTQNSHSHFMRPYYRPDSASNPVGSGAWLIGPDGTWRTVAIEGYVGDVRIAPENAGDDYIWSRTTDNTYRAYTVMERLMDAYGGDRLLIPMILIQLDPEDETYGILDGAFRCQGVANAAENLITSDGTDHLVVQNVFRTAFNDYWAMALE